MLSPARREPAIPATRRRTGPSTAPQTTRLRCGGSLQAASTEPVFGHGNNFLLGGSIDYSTGNFNSNNTLGFIYPDLFVGINRAIPGNGAIIHTLGDIGFAPVDTSTRQTYYGLYALDTFDIDERLSLIAGGRLNVASIGVGDRLGTAPRAQQQPDLCPFQSGYRADLQAHPGSDGLFRLFAIEPGTDAARIGLFRSEPGRAS